MYEEEEEEEGGGIFLLIIGVLALVLLVVAVVARSGEDLPAATVTGPTTSVVEGEPEPEATTVAPTTTEAPATTTAAPTTTEAPGPFSLWDALLGSNQAGDFAAVGGAFGLQPDLEIFEDEDDQPLMRTLFAPSDAALAAFGPEAVGALAADADAANALVGYHFLPDALSAEDLVELDGQTVLTRTGLPLRINVVDGEVVLNDVARVVGADFNADNGVVHIVDTVLVPPTVNEAIGLDNIEFEVSSTVITPAGIAVLNQAVEFFESNDSNAVIGGHTDTDGGDGENLALSQGRAESVLAFLIEAGLDGSRFTATGFGETQPILDANGVEDKEASRRIEFVLR